MCGRTALTTTPEDLREAFGLDELPQMVPHYNVPPSQPVAVVRASRDGTARRTLESLRWGLVPPWAKDPKIGHKLALARVETVATTNAFRDALRRRRCLVVVDGFFEWKRDGSRPSQPYFLRRPDHAPFALAGVWERWISPDGEVLESCAIVTQPALPPVDAVHDRMPVVLEREAWGAWLDPVLREPGALAPLLAPHPPVLVAFPVSSRVNDPRHDDRTVLERADPPQLSLLADDRSAAPARASTPDADEGRR
jgi:putative SOS response-associated peptidase YedK